MKKLIILLILCGCNVTPLCAQPIKFYFAVDQTADKVKIKEWFHKYDVEYYIINKRGGFIFATALIKDHNELPNLKKVFEVEGFIILAAFKQDGAQVGRTKIVKTPAVYDKDGSLVSPAIYEYVGKISYPINTIGFLQLMRDVKTYDVDGNELSSIRPTEVRETHNFAGWEVPKAWLP